jgi:hypothetical protein
MEVIQYLLQVGYFVALRDGKIILAYITGLKFLNVPTYVRNLTQYGYHITVGEDERTLIVERTLMNVEKYLR